jgi:hypothetical protein
MSGSITDKDRVVESLGYPSLVGSIGALVALAGGAQAGTPISGRFNRFVTVATAADSGQLPPALPGRIAFVKNAAAANSMNVFPQTGEVINALAANAAFAVAAGKSCEFYCVTLGTWETNLSA